MKKQKSNLSAFSLVEVALAIGIASFCLLVILGLLGTGITSSRVSTNETLAINVMNQVVDDLQVAVAGQAALPVTSPFYQITIPQPGASSTMTGSPTATLYVAGNGTWSTTATNSPAFRVTVGFVSPAQTTGVYPGPTAHVLVTWPALADSTPTTWPSKYTSSVETVFALDRN